MYYRTIDSRAHRYCIGVSRIISPIINQYKAIIYHISVMGRLSVRSHSNVTDKVQSLLHVMDPRELYSLLKAEIVGYRELVI